MCGNTDYKEMYLKMVRASEQAIKLLVEAQQTCEELYLSSQEETGDDKRHISDTR